jgi:hypothetical protein
MSEEEETKEFCCDKFELFFDAYRIEFKDGVWEIAFSHLGTLKAPVRQYIEFCPFCGVNLYRD